MAKAALNMMTRTSAADYAKSGIYMTAVDTGAPRHHPATDGGRSTRTRARAHPPMPRPVPVPVPMPMPMPVPTLHMPTLHVPARTGWINDEKPAERAAADANTHNFQTPIDEVDAAARVLDPIIAPLRRLAAGEKADPPFGCFLKDYGKCEW